MVMNINDLNTGNFSDYSPLALSNETENIERSCYHGLMAYEDSTATGAIIWNTREEGDRMEDEISFFSADSRDIAAELLKKHEETMDDECISLSFTEAAAMPEIIREALAGADYRVEETESRDIIIRITDFMKSKISKVKIPPYVMNTGSLQGMEFWNGLTYCLYNSRKGLLEDLDTLREEWFEPDLSCCVKTDKWVEGLLLIHRLPSGVLMPVLLFCGGRDDRKNLIYMIRYAMSAAVRKYPPDTRILIRRHNDPIRNLTAYLFPQARGETVIRGEKKR